MWRYFIRPPISLGLVETCIQICDDLGDQIDFMREHVTFRNFCRTFRLHVRPLKAVGLTAFGMGKICHPDSPTDAGTSSPVTPCIINKECSTSYDSKSFITNYPYL